MVLPNDVPVSEVLVEYIQNNKIIASKYANEEGVASIELEKGEYFINIKYFPEGYVFLRNTHKVNEETKDIVIKLFGFNVIEEGDGSQSYPFLLATGYYLTTFEVVQFSGMQYYEFIAPESGTYTLESFSNSNFSENYVDPYLIFITENGDFDKTGNVDSNINSEFKYTFEVEAGESYKFIALISVATSMPASFLIKISK